ncbi:putative oxidoreductase YcjS [Polystyrenella longa]|uniref:Putative oxidoreductase YcjS n=1 Tax=Polystyrenella longa TaxID=2528007 RepID=A0A518CP39_9PLAN|nr:Gfo/Idh/MocA family oxidoreductase [Polystyrenella longa]QDU80991.1 putative oxidoreductase YcjS [Polystyrenella longa]
MFDKLSPRRDFLKQTGVGLTSLALGSLTSSLPSARAADANDRIRMAVIGCGGQGVGAHIRGLMDIKDEANVELVAVCDPDEERRQRGSENGGGATPVADIRRLLEDDSIDAVSIATPDHWHVPAALLAMQAGKHVYVEKPCSHNLREGRLLVEASLKHNRIVQHGTQMRSNGGFQEAVEMLHSGLIGDVMIARVWNIQKRSSIGHMKPSDPPQGLDYDMWVGPAPMVPYQENRSHYNWHWWHNFGTGDAGNDGVHEFDLARWGLGVNEHPTTIAALGGKYFFDDDQQFPDTMTATFEYPATDDRVAKQLVFEMRLWSTSYPYNVDSGIEFYGTKGKMFLSRRGKLEVWDGQNKNLQVDVSGPLQMHVPNNQKAFLAAIRGEAPATADAETAHLSASLCHLANISTRLGRNLSFDKTGETISNDEEANTLLGREYRENHWAIPPVS